MALQPAAPGGQRLTAQTAERTGLLAFLVCYSMTVEDHPRDPAAYLPQGFYETISRVCRAEGSGFPILGRIARLRYKSPTLLVGRDELPRLVAELHLLRDANGARDLLAAAEKALERPCSLTISADMCPELPCRPSTPTDRPWWRFW